MRTSTFTGLIAALSLMATPALAVDNGIYIGASVGQAGVDLEDDIEGIAIDYDADSTGFKAIVGWRFLDWLAVEGNWVDLGSGDDEVQGEKFEIGVSGPSLSVVGFWPIGPVDLFGRVGAVNWEAELEDVTSGEDFTEDGTDLTYGVGAQFRVWGLSIRAEYERFEADLAKETTVDMVSLGLTWTFF